MAEKKFSAFSFAFKTLFCISDTAFIFYDFLMKQDIIFFGIQGSWKWTQAKRFLEENSSYKYLEPWQVFRALSSNENIISSYIKERMSQGKMLDDCLAFDLFDMYFHLLEDNQFILADGFPRTLPQMHYFLSSECMNKRDFVGVYFDIPREIAIQRIENRAKEQNRADDLDMNVINKRLDTFEDETLPVIKYFDSIWKLVTVDACVSVDEIYQNVMTKLGNC